MSVPADRRPENRFALSSVFNDLARRILATLAPNTDAFNRNPLIAANVSHVFGQVVECRKCLMMFNACDLFDDVQYASRRDYQMRLRDGLHGLYAFYEMLALTLCEAAMHGDVKSHFSAVFEGIHKSLRMLDSVIRSDASRRADGKEATRRKYQELKNRDFNVPHMYDNTKATESTLKMTDRFNIRDFVFVGMDSTSNGGVEVDNGQFGREG